MKFTLPQRFLVGILLLAAGFAITMERENPPAGAQRIWSLVPEQASSQAERPREIRRVPSAWSQNPAPQPPSARLERPRESMEAQRIKALASLPQASPRVAERPRESMGAQRIKSLAPAPHASPRAAERPRESIEAQRTSPSPAFRPSPRAARPIRSARTPILKDDFPEEKKEYPLKKFVKDQARNWWLDNVVMTVDPKEWQRRKIEQLHSK